MLCQEAENRGRCGTRRHVGLELDGIPVQSGQFQSLVVFQSLGQFGIGLGPFVVFLAAGGHDLLQFLGTLCVEFLDFLADHPGILGIACP